MRFLGVTLIKDLKRLLRDPLSLVLALGLPLIIGFLISVTFGREGGKPSARLLVADHDDSFVSGLLTGTFGQGELANLVVTEAVEEDEGRERLDKGKASGLLIIPEDFSENVLNRRPVAVTLITNPAQTILPGILEQTLVTVTDGLSTLQHVLGGVIDPLAEGPPEGSGTFPDSQMVSTTLAVNRVMESAGPLLFPPVIRVETVIEEDEKKKEKPKRGFADFFFPSMFFMGVLFMAQGRSDDFWHERMAGTLRRTRVAPQPLGIVLLGKALTSAVAILGVTFVGLLAAKWIFRLNVGSLPLAALWGALAGTVMLLFFMLLQNLAGTQRGGNVLTNALLFPLIMLGGSFFPFEAMPEWLARIGKLTPNGWALVRFKEILWGDAAAPALAVGALGLLAVGAVLYVINLMRLRAIARS